ARAFRDRNNNQPPQPGIYPDYEAPVIVAGADGEREMRNMRWGMPSSKKALLEAANKRADGLRRKGTEFDFAELLRLEPDKGTTNVRNTTSVATGQTNAHWRPWLGPANRCLVPFTSFAEPDQDLTCPCGCGYAVWRDVSNRPSRGASTLRSGSACCVQV